MTDYTKHIKAYQAKGLKVLPLNGKSPKEPDWQNRDLDTHAVIAPYSDPAIGVQMGPKSGVIDFEYDSDAQKRRLVEIFGDQKHKLLVCPRFKSKHGEHFWFAWDDRLEETNAGNLSIPCDNGEKLIVRIGAAGKGSQSAVPPSPGKTWLPNKSILEIGAPKLPENVIELLLSHSRPPDVEVTDDPDTEATPEQLASCKEALANLPEAVEGDAGGGRTINAACEIRRHGVYGEQGYGLLQEFNETKCVPPWEENDLRRKWEEAKKFEPSPLAEFDAIEDPSKPGNEVKKPSGPLYRLVTSSELATEDFKIEFAINDTLVEGQPLIVAGPQKVLKTSLLIDAAISLASGGHVLGKLRVKRPYRTLLMSGESGLPTLKESAKRICVPAKTDLASLDNLLWSPDLPKIGEPTHTSALRRVIIDNDVEVLIIEPAYLCMPGADAGNLFTQGELLFTVSSLCQELGVTLIMAHHTKKISDRGGKNQPLSLTDIAWAGFQEFARQWWLLNRRERYEEGSGEHRLWLSVGGSVGHSALWGVDVSEGVRSEFAERHWKVDTFPGGQAGERDWARVLNVDSDKVLAYLRMTERGDVLRGIERGAKLSHSKVKAAIEKLKSESKVEPCQVPRSKQAYPGFRIRKEDTALLLPTAT